MDVVLQSLRDQQQTSLDQLFEFLRIPSVSADSAFQPQMQLCAEFVRKAMEAAGLSAEIIPTKGHPIVYGERIEDASLPTVLVYGHYDVQPPDPLELWTRRRLNRRFETERFLLVEQQTTRGRSSRI